MPSSRIQSAAVILALSLAQQSCLFKKEPRKATIIVPPTPQPPPPKPMAAPPSLPTQGGPTLQSDGTVPELPAPAEEPAKKPKRPPRRTGGSNPANTQQAPVEQQQPGEAPPETPAPVVPSLTPILGQRETSERNKRISAYLEKARLNVYRAERRRLDGSAQGLLTQVKTFVQQAEEARRSDLVRAENLAERAEVLSRGLNP
jgi:hypothetical protein